MKFYVEIFNKSDELIVGYIKTNLTPEQVAEAYSEHPAGCFNLSAVMADRLGIKDLDFQNKDYQLSAVREFSGETYEYMGEKFYPPPMFLPDCFNSRPVRSKE